MLRPTRARLSILSCWIAAAGTVHSYAQPTTRTLRNGVSICPSAAHPWDCFSYYGCQDTGIDPAEPAANFGRQPQLGLLGGTGRRVLIRFGDLNRVVGPGQQITNAYLRLHTVPGAWTPGNGVQLYRLLQHWRQGSMAAEPQPQHWTVSWDYRLYSANPAEARPWGSPGASQPGVDRAASATVSTNTATNYNATAGTWQVNGLTGDVAEFYANQTANCGWVLEYTDPGAATGGNWFYGSEVPTLALRPELVVTFTSESNPPSRAVDLDVTCIGRTPEYLRYIPVYEEKWFHSEYVGIMKNPGYATLQKWPDNGDTVTFTAHVSNKGTTGHSGPFGYRWLINGQVVATGQEPSGIAPGSEKTYAHEWIWDANDYLNGSALHRKSLDHRDRVVTFQVDHDELVAEQSENNNALSQFLEAPGLGFYVEQSFYDLFHNTRNALGSYSFEDWLNWHVQVWNDVYFEMSRFEGFAEDGAYERARVQKIAVVPDGTLSGGNHIPGGVTNYYLDGEWGFEINPDAQAYIDRFAAFIEGGLLHECTHQLGLLDVYTMNMEAGTPSNPLKVQVKDGGQYYITRGYYPACGGLMGGGDTRYGPGHEATGLYASHDIGGINSNTGVRRGFYGEYLYDIPQTVRIRALDATGAPLPGAGIKIWQSSGGTIRDVLSWQPILTATADAQGILTLPNVSTLEPGPFTTLTGHTLRSNPWGRVSVVGVNGVLLIKVSAYGQFDYAFFMLHEVNPVFWRGEVAEYTFDLRVQIAPDPDVSATNIAQGKPATSNVGGSPALAVDGNVNTRWDPGNVPANAYLQVNLGTNHDVARVVLFQNGWGGDFFQQFRIETSLTGAFAGEQRLFAREPISWGRACGDRRDMDPADPEQDALWVTYAGFPHDARYVRITAEQGNWTKLAELRIHAAAAESVPPADVTDLAVVDMPGSAALLSWTAPGDDGWAGRAEAYDLRYATTPITPANFASAWPAPAVPEPLPGGLVQTCLLEGLTPGQTYYVALRAKDNGENWSGLSNVATVLWRGDLNCDGAVNAFDIDPFVLALTNPAGYQATYPDCNLLNADIDCDGVVNAFDIDPFVTCLTTGGCDCP